MPLSIQSLRDFVQRAAARPGMYFCPVTLDQYGAVIYGYEAAMMDENVVTELPVSHAFSKWLARRWDSLPNVVWQGPVQERYGNGEEAIREASKLIADYLAGERPDA